MRASLLLLFVLFYGASANNINWDECGKTAICRVHHSCNDESSPFELKLREYSVSKTNRKCAIGIHIKPETKEKWTISIVNEDQKSPAEFQWMIEDQEIFKCKGNIIEPGKAIGNELTVENIRPSTTDYAYCVFTVESKKQPSKVLDPIRESSVSRTSDFRGNTNAYEFQLEFFQVNNIMPCKWDELYNQKTCNPTEDCLKINPMSPCLPSYTSLFRQDKNSNFTEAAIKCSGGEFSWTSTDTEGNTKKGSASVGESEAKCARKKCSLCKAKDNFTLLYTEPEAFDRCAYLKCEKGFMVINGDELNALTIRPSETVQCSDKTDVSLETITTSSKHARWVVNGDHKIIIDTAVCKDSVNCESLLPIATLCENSDTNCHLAELTVTGVYVCKESQTMHVVQNQSIGPINSPLCENSTWIITSNSSVPVEWRPEGNITIKCIERPPVHKIVSADTSFPYWVIILIIVFLLIIVAIAIGAYCYLERKKKQKAAASVPTTTTTTSKTSSKPSSSGEKEPLTSAMKSVTADSIKTAIEQKPVVLANADLRPVTAAASDSSDKKKEKKSEPSKKEDKKEEKREKNRDPSAGMESDDTSKNDGTSTKEKFAPFPKSGEDPLKSKTGGDGESQIEKIKNEESTKLLPKPKRQYSKTSGASAKAKTNNDFLNVTDYSEEEPSKTGSKKRGKKRQA